MYVFIVSYEVIYKCIIVYLFFGVNVDDLKFKILNLKYISKIGLRKFFKSHYYLLADASEKKKKLLYDDKRIYL